MLIDELKKENLRALKEKDQIKKGILSVVINKYMILSTDKNHLESKVTDEEVLNGSKKHPDFEWNYAQHSAYLNKNGNLIMFDNGDARFNQATGRNYIENRQYSRFAEYKIDEQNMTVQQVYSFGENNVE